MNKYIVGDFEDVLIGTDKISKLWVKEYKGGSSLWVILDKEEILLKGSFDSEEARQMFKMIIRFISLNIEDTPRFFYCDKGTFERGRF